MDPLINSDSQKVSNNIPSKDNFQEKGTSEIQIQFNNDKNNEIENNQNMNDNNSDFVNNNEEENIQNIPVEEENNENVENDNQNIENLENENNYENNNNEPNEFNNINQNNQDENMEINNEIDEAQNFPQMINIENMDESLQNYIYDLQNRLNSVINENQKLKMINQNIVVGLNDSNKRNMAMNQKIKILNLQNQKMN